MANGAPGALALGGGDPRLNDEKPEIEGALVYNDRQTVGPSQSKLQRMHARDPNVSWEEYNYYAQEARAEEDAAKLDEPRTSLYRMLIPNKSDKAIDPNAYKVAKGGDSPPGYNQHGDRMMSVTETDWINAQRAVRTASGAGAFYLITTDILGPFGLAFSFGTVGYVPGAVLFTIFAVLAGYSGYLLNYMFLGVDSYKYPLKSYGDMAYRIYGNIVRIPINILQSIQLILTVSLITISNGQALSVIARFKLCYIVCVVILVVCGMLIGQIRTLQKFGWIANVAVFFNVSIMVITMVVVTMSPPNYGAAGILSAGAFLGDGSIGDGTAPFPPITHYIGLPQTGSFVAALNGIMNTVFAYGGANIFNEFMAEMKHPRDFLKAMWCAQAFIWFVYMFYGLFMYWEQGQYSVSPSPQSVSPYWALVVANLLYILSAGIAAALYGNIGLKVFYNNILVELLRFPPLTVRTGKILWIFFIPIYWAVAFVIGAVIPNFNALVAVVGAICIVQFTYSLPPFLYIGYKIKENAMLEGEGFDPATGNVIRHNRGFKRFWRGLTGGSALSKAVMAWNFIYMLGALALGGLGAYAAIIVIIESFAHGSPGVTTFSCTSPLDFESF